MTAYSVYPKQIDNSSSLPLAVDKQTSVRAEVINRINDAVVNVESELGTNPSGIYGTVKARLNALEGTINTFTFPGSVIDNFTPTAGQIIFTLTKIAAFPSASLMFINGVIQQYGTDYTVEDNILTYIPGIPLISTDTISVSYFVGAATGITGSFSEEIIVTNGQTSITLTKIPAVPNSTLMFVNGVMQPYGLNFTISGSIVTYVSSIALINTDTVAFTYLYK